MPAFDPARVRVLLEALCDLEPELFSVVNDNIFWTFHETRNGRQGEYLWRDGYANSNKIRHALEGLHDARGWTVAIVTGTFNGSPRYTTCEIVMDNPLRIISVNAPTRLEAMLVATVKALGGLYEAI